MSEDSSGERGAGRSSRSGDGRDARPVTAAGRRRRAEGLSDDADSGVVTGSRTAGKGTATPTRDRAQATPQGSLITRLQRYLREVVAELRKVHWPSRKQIVTYTIVVLVFVSFMVALVAGLDAVFAKAVFALFG